MHRRRHLAFGTLLAAALFSFALTLVRCPPEAPQAARVPPRDAIIPPVSRVDDVPPFPDASVPEVRPVAGPSP